MEITKKLKNDLFKYLNIQVDFRSKYFKDLLKEYGNKEALAVHLQSRLNKHPKYAKNLKQRETQKKYNENNKKERYIGNIIVEYEITVERERREKEEGQPKKHKGKLVKYLQKIRKIVNITLYKI